MQHSLVSLSALIDDAKCFALVRRHRWPEGHPQGCSTLWNAEEVEEAIEAANGGAEAILGE